MTSLLILISLLLLLCLPAMPVCAAKAAPAHSEEAKKPLCWGLALDGYPVTEAMLATSEREVNLAPPQIILFFLQWPSAPAENAFPRESLDAISKRGAIPCITWEPMYYAEGREVVIAHERILNGDYDSYLVSFARAARDWRKPVIIRFAHEMNIERYHWGTEKAEYGPRSPEIYRQMFRYVVSVFRREGASNVIWAFCPNSESLPNPSSSPDNAWNEASRYYPGDEYVDVVGADGYNWGTTQTREKDGWDSRWRSFRDIFTPIHSRLRTLAPGKPFFVFETATVTEGGDKEGWIKEAIHTAGEWKIEGIIWFQVNKEQDWRFGTGVGNDYASTLREKLGRPASALEKMMGAKPN